MDARVKPAHDDADYNIDGSTRSGGRWPSMKVLMLIMTFSPCRLIKSIAKATGSDLA